MKAMILLVLLLFCSDTIQTQTKTQPTETVMDINCPELIIPLLNEFVSEGNKRGVPLGWFLSKNLHKVHVIGIDEMDVMDDNPTQDSKLVGKIIYKKIPTGISGYYSWRTEIYLSKRIFDGKYLTKTVMFHELGHFFGLPHNPKEEADKDKFLIMNDETPGLSIILAPPSEEVWERYLDTLFKKIDESDKAMWMDAKRNDGV